MNTEFPKLRRETAAAEVARLIREKILTGELTAGQRLPAERELSEALGVSRPTVREALRSLVAMNILDSRHGSGTFVSDLGPSTLTAPLSFAMALSPATVTELFEARLVVEPELAALAAARATVSQRQGLDACLRQAREHQTGRGSAEPEVMLELDVRLHRLIATAAHNNLLSQMLETISGLGQDSRVVTVMMPGVAEATITEHERIAAAIICGDAAGARAAMTEHLSRIAEAALAAARSPRRSRNRRTPRSST